MSLTSEINNKQDSPDELTTNVKSVNDWEHCNLDGDSKRHNKFLKLMGADKKDHTGTFVIGDQNERTHEDTTSQQSDLCKQYTSGMQHRNRTHNGLGFENADESKEASTEAKAGSPKAGSPKAKDTTKADGTTQVEPVTTKQEVEKSTAADCTKGTDLEDENSAKRCHVSSNDWEHSHLENDTDERHHKFLKLMGADKTEHTGKFIIGEHDALHARKDTETKVIEDRLEREYESSEIRNETDYKKQENNEKYKGIGYPHISDKTSTN